MGDEMIIVDSFDWEQVGKLHDRLALVDDSNIDTAARAEERGEAYLREAEIESTSGTIRVPVNCGQQLYDVIDITDERAGLSEEKKRVSFGVVMIRSYDRDVGDHPEVTAGPVHRPDQGPEGC